MNRLFHFSPSRLALSYVALSALVLALFAIPLWYAWSVNISTFKEYVHAEDVQRMADVFARDGAPGLAAAIEARTAGNTRDEIVVLADPSRVRIAGNLPAWPAEVPDLAGTYGLVLGQPGSSMRVVASHVLLPGGYHLLMGRESARFQSLVDYFWFGIAGATAIILVLGAVIGWVIRRALLFEVREMSRTAAAIVQGDLSRRLPTRSASDSLATLARTVNGMLEQLSGQNVQLAGEIAVRRQAEHALQQAHEDLERLVAQRTEQLRKTNESLRRSEAYLAEAQQLARVGSFGIRIESRELVCSEETMRIAAFEPGTRPTLEDAFARVHPEDRSRIQALVEQGLRDRSLLEYEHRLLLPDGSVKHVHVVAHTIKDESSAGEFVGAVVDITEQKKSQDALRAAKARFEGILEIADDAIIAVDSSQRIILFNQGAEKVFGYTQEEVVGEALDLLVPLRFTSTHREHVEEFARSPGIARAMGGRREVFGLRKNGREFPAEASISKLDLGGQLLFTVILRDVTDRKFAEEELRRQRTYLDELFELAPDAIVMTALENPRNLRVNREFTRMFGYTADEAVGRRLRHLIAPDDLEPANLTENPDLLAGRTVEREVVRQRKDGTRFHAHITAKRVHLRDGEDAVYIIYRDITERKRAEALLAGEKRLLEMIAKGGPLAATLDALCRLAEEVGRDSRVSILLLDRKGERFRHGAAPGLPDSYTAQVDGLPVGPGIGPCGLAAHLNEQVIASDLASDERWPEYRALAVAHGLRACWSTPIASSDGRVLGTFAIFWSEPRSPAPQEKTQIEQLTHLASIAIERAAAIDALHRSEERYALAVEASGEGHWDWNIPTDEYYCSPRMLELYGFPPGTTFKSRADFLARFPFHPEDRARWDEAIAAHFAGKTARFDIEIRVIPRGETRWIHLTGLLTRDASGEPVRWTGSVADITERRCAEDALRLSELRYALAMEATGDGHWDWNMPADKMYVSPLLLEMCGLPRDRTFASRSEWVEQFPFYPGERPRYSQAVADHFAGKTDRVDIEIRIVPRGETRWVHMTGRCSRDASGTPVRWAGSVTDVTARHLAEEELQRMEHQLRQAQRLEAVGTLAGGIAHDFNNLLGAILGYGEMALRDAPAGSRLRRDVENIMIAGERGRALVDRILAFSRSGVGERVAVHVEEVMRETLALLAARLPRGILIDERLNAGRAAVMGDATQIHQVLMNLITNAVQAMPSGGTLLVSLDRMSVHAPRAAATGAIAVRDYVVLEVTDTGTGIRSEILEKIFDPFFSTKEVGVGTGLGLSLVHGIVTGLGGVIDVATVVGKGSVFSVYLPQTGEVATPRRAKKLAEPDPRRGGHERVLVVDDEASLVRLATETLTELGYTAVGFTASAAALEAFLADPLQFDAVITDESMPGMSGSELIRRMRPVRPTLPIVLVSGYLSAPVVQRAREAGATEVLKKPLSAGQLATALDRALHASRGPPAADLVPVPPGKRATRQTRRPRTQPSPAPSKRR